jgi:hypothetical protein
VVHYSPLAFWVFVPFNFLKLYTGGSTPSTTVAMLSFKDAAKAVVAMGVATKKDPECVRVVVRCSPRFRPRALFALSPLLPRVVPAVWGGMRQMREQTRHAADWRGPGQKLPRCSSPRRARQSRIDSGCGCTAGGHRWMNATITGR